MRLIVATVLILILSLPGCLHRAVTMSNLLGKEEIEASYLLADGAWVPDDSLSWSDRSWYRELRFDTDGDGTWNYLYAEVYDDISGWTWIPSSARINPEEEPELARTKRYLVRDKITPPRQPSLDDFGYDDQ